MEVLDIFVAPEEFVIANAIDHFVALWRIPLNLHANLPDGWTRLNSRMMDASPLPVTRQNMVVSMESTAAHDPGDQTWTVTLTDKIRPGAPETIVYHQVKAAWKFEPEKPVRKK